MIKTKIYKIEGMQCSGCADNIETNIKKIENVDNVEVNFDAKSLTVTGNPDEKNVENVIESLGYGITK